MVKFLLIFVLIAFTIMGTGTTTKAQADTLSERGGNPLSKGLRELVFEPRQGIISLQYKTGNNITGKPLYPKDAKAYLHPDAIKALKKATSYLNSQGYGITVLDAWRPSISGARLWNKALELGIEGYYCPPNDSSHSKGIAVDVTLHRLENPSIPVQMPTEFDEPTSPQRYPLCPEKTKRARILKEAMNKAGFIGHLREWWHFSLPNQKKYPLVKGERKRLIPVMNY
jgi:D-alanyl-D-alanine dipeptidase